MRSRSAAGCWTPWARRPPPAEGPPGGRRLRLQRGPLYLDRVRASLEGAGFQVCSFVFPAGEEHKNGQTYLDLLEFLAQRHITRADTLVALGGGVVGDLTGFAAATFLRGVAFVQLPTTLLAAVDASVGGKTAIDLKNGKNLAGAFYQPKVVLCDLDTLSTPPQAVFADGCAEVIKYGMIGDPGLLEQLETTDFQADPRPSSPGASPRSGTWWSRTSSTPAPGSC